ncbi:MAG: tetratricopeptide repeat protein [Actinomycetota bacterium]
MPRRKSTHVDDPVAVGLRLREARERAGLSQRQLSFPGCSPAYISRIEAGDRIPSLQLLREMGRRLGVSEDYLATGMERGDDAAGLVDAEIALRLDEVEQADVLFRDALERAANPEERARALAGLGQLEFRAGNPRGAISRLEEARRTSSGALADHPAWADTLGRAYSMLDNMDASIAIFRESAHAAEERNDPVEGVRFAVLLANALIDNNEFSEAEELLERTIEIAPDSRDPIFRARIYWSHSRLHTHQNNSGAAARYARRALELLDLTEHTYYAALAHQLLAHIELDRDRPREALELIRAGLAMLDDSGTKVDHALFRLEEARSLLKVGERDEAAAVAMESAGVLADASPIDAGRGYMVMAEVFEELGDREKAREVYELAVEVLSALPTRYLLEAYQKLAALLEADGLKDEALEVLKKAVAIRAEAHH